MRCAFCEVICFRGYFYTNQVEWIDRYRPHMCICCAIAMPNIPNNQDPEIAKNQLFQCPTFSLWGCTVSHHHAYGWEFNCMPWGWLGPETNKCGYRGLFFRWVVGIQWMHSIAHLPTNLLPVCDASSFVHVCPSLSLQPFRRQSRVERWFGCHGVGPVKVLVDEKCGELSCRYVWEPWAWTGWVAGCLGMFI